MRVKYMVYKQVPKTFVKVTQNWANIKKICINILIPEVNNKCYIFILHISGVMNLHFTVQASQRERNFIRKYSSKLLMLTKLRQHLETIKTAKLLHAAPR